MALGFRNCCNEFEYFLLKDTPANVSEFEVYYIETLEGPSFCGIYVNLPPINYSPPVYNVAVLSLQGTFTVGCDNCVTLNPCPTEENILLNQFGAGSVVQIQDCNYTGIIQMQVECDVTDATYENSNDGVVRLFVIGGTPPYSFSELTMGVLPVTFIEDNVYTLIPNATVGNYRLTVVDSIGDFTITVNCTVGAAPPLPVFDCNTTDATFYEKPDGVLDFLVLSAGTPPYRYYFGNSQFQIPIPTSISQGTYNIRYEDQYYVQFITCTVGGPPEVIWPDKLCLSFNSCGTEFRLNFLRQTNPIKIDYRAWYLCQNPESVGCERLALYYDETNIGGWNIELTNITLPIQYTVPCPGAGPVNLIETFSAIKTDLTSDQPMGIYKINGVLSSNATITKDGCLPLLGPIVVNQFKSVQPVENGSILVKANGGTGDFTYFLESSKETIVAKTSFIDGLKPGTYTITAQDSSGQLSDTKTFTVSAETPFNLFSGFTPCVRATYTNTWINQLPGGTSVGIETGDTRASTIDSQFNFNFSHIPKNAILTAKILVELTTTVVVGKTGYTDPNIVVLTNPEPINMEVTTNGLTTNIFENVLPSFTSYPYVQNGAWFKQSDGNTCCLFPSVEGVKYVRQLIWKSNEFTFDNTTNVTTLFRNYFENSIPLSRYQKVGCSKTSYCSGYVETNLKFYLYNINSVAGNVYFTEKNKELYKYTFRSHSDGTADWVSGELPNPSCT
jgi:hypothetical protein